MTTSRSVRTASASDIINPEEDETIWEEEIENEEIEDDITISTPSQINNNTLGIRQVTNLLTELPSVEEVEAFIPVVEAAGDDENYEQLYDLAVQEYLDEVQRQVKGVRKAYDSLDDQDREAIDPDLLKRLTALEAYFLLDAVRSPRTGGRTISDDATYTFDQAGAAADFPLVISGGNPTIILNSVNFDATGRGAPAIDITDGSSVTLKINDTNILKGGRTAGGQGCAAIRVADGSSLTIEGGDNDELEVYGGDGNSGGAGIGSNGMDDCGAIVINGGKITAKGGKPLVPYRGGGAAGIGTGGAQAADWEFTGTITITNGTVDATGNNHTGNSSSLAGAGIGSGGVNSGFSPTSKNSMEITITGGNIIAAGIDDSAGIGGGGNASSGTIEISGGNIAATGIRGGAAIGGSYNRNADDILISGGTIEAISTYGGAGIGGGYGGGVSGSIVINGDADVTARGGSLRSMGAAPGGVYLGSAGIGTGVGMNMYDGADITIGGAARVRAYSGGHGANAIGWGTPFYRNSSNRPNADNVVEGLATVIHIGSDVDLLAIVDDKSTDAVALGPITLQRSDQAGQIIPIETTIENPAELLYYSYMESAENAYPLPDIEADTNPSYQDPSGGISNIYQWTHSGNELTIIDVDSYIYDGEDPGNWAVLHYQEPRNVTVTFEWGTNQDTPSDVNPPDALSVEPGQEFTIPPVADTDEYSFGGWFTDPDCLIPFTDNKTDVDLILYGKWAKKAPPKVTVTFEWGTNQAAPPGVSTPSNLTVAPGETFTVPQLPDTDEYRFGGWFTDPECTIPFTDNKTDADITLYGKWTRKTTEDITVTVSFEWGTDQEIPQGVILPANLTVRPGEIFSVPQLADTNEYRFGGWFTDPECTIPFTANRTDVDITLYGKWIRKEVSGQGNLTVSKIVSGRGASITKAFPFTVTLSDNTLNGTYGRMTFENGIAVFTLRHGESITAEGLTEGMSYTVTESDNSGYRVTASGSNGTIAAGSTSVAAFVNYRSSGSSDNGGDSGGGDSSGGSSGGGSNSGGGPGAIPKPGETLPPMNPEDEAPVTPDIPAGETLPRTGDASNLAFLYLMLSLSAAALVILKRRRTNRD